jgi:hypothetical protein
METQWPVRGTWCLKRCMELSRLTALTVQRIDVLCKGIGDPTPGGGQSSPERSCCRLIPQGG